MMDDKMTPTTQADALQASAAEPRYNRERVTLHVPADVAEYIKENGGSGFVVGLVRGVMPR